VKEFPVIARRRWPVLNLTEKSDAEMYLDYSVFLA
jgi:hypothetical protein